MSVPKWNELQPKNNDINIINKIKNTANKSAYDLLVLMHSKSDFKNKKYLQIATSESLTAGLIMSTLVDIPWGGCLKYGSTCVYDSDAKRVLNGVKIDNVYTHRCAKEMAVGLLNNSNATIGIAVTGNAMPLLNQQDMLGETFICIAGYDKSGNIIYTTKSINSCLETESESFKNVCKKWYNKMSKNVYNTRTKTATVSQGIRNYVVYAALKECKNFINEYNPTVPKFIKNRIKKNNIITKECLHTNIPKNKYNITGKILCANKNKNECVDVNTCNRINTKLYNQ